ncbi:outer membrane pore protein [Escherichia coli]|nr:outer membrane pore protein [Escherichia coli]
MIKDAIFHRAVNIATRYHESGTWICPYISRHLLSLNPLLACCRRYSRGER